MSKNIVQCLFRGTPQKIDFIKTAFDEAYPATSVSGENLITDIGYSVASVTQPNHEWVMTSVRRADGVYNQTLEDTGINVNLGDGYSAGHTDAVAVDGTAATVANIQGKEVFKSDGTLIGECTTRNTNNSITFGEGLVIDLDDDESLYVAQIPDTGSAGNKPLSIYGPKTPGHGHKA